MTQKPHLAWFQFVLVAGISQTRDSTKLEVLEAFLEPLPALLFEVCSWVYGCSVDQDLHVVFEQNSYSAPRALVDKKVDLKVVDAMVEAYSTVPISLT